MSNFGVGGYNRPVSPYPAQNSRQAQNTNANNSGVEYNRGLAPDFGTINDRSTGIENSVSPSQQQQQPGGSFFFFLFPLANVFGLNGGQNNGQAQNSVNPNPSQGGNPQGQGSFFFFLTPLFSLFSTNGQTNNGQPPQTENAVDPNQQQGSDPSLLLLLTSLFKLLGLNNDQQNGSQQQQTPSQNTQTPGTGQGNGFFFFPVLFTLFGQNGAQQQQGQQQQPQPAQPPATSSTPASKPVDVARDNQGNAQVKGMNNGDLQNSLNKLASDPEGSRLLKDAQSRGVSIQQGDTPSGVLGQYNPFTNSIKVKDPKDIGTIAHELVHATTPQDGDSQDEEGVANIIGSRVAARINGQPQPNADNIFQRTLPLYPGLQGDNPPFRDDIHGVIGRSV